MSDSIHPKPLTRSPRARLLAAAVIGGILVAGCGAGSQRPPVANVERTTTSSPSAASAGAGATPPSTAPTVDTRTTTRSRTTTSNGTANSGPFTQAAIEADELAYSKCMRANGVPDFPDPNAGGGFKVAVPAGADASSPSFKAAQTKCATILPGIGGLGSGPPPSAQAVAHWVTVAQCMRRHGVSNFPDPRTTAPSHPPAGGGVISDRDGVILVFPHAIDMQSPIFTRAATACGFQLTNHG